MDTKTLFYTHGTLPLKGYIAYDASSTKKRPAILVAHAWRGQDDFARKKAEEFALMGYVGFAVDLYGEGKEAPSNEEAAALMQPLFQDRALLQARTQAAFSALSAHPLVDTARIGGIGFCFGGLAIIELFRSGAPITAAASFHAVLGSQMGEMQAKTFPLAKDIRGSILILHGYEDPLVSQADIQAIQKELNDAKIDWQMHIFGQTSHAFTVPGANDPSMGLQYNQLSDKRSWHLMRQFFQELL